MKSLVKLQPTDLASENINNFDSRGFCFKFHDYDGGLSVTDLLGAQNNNDSSVWWPSGVAAIDGTGTPLATDKGFITPNGVDNRIHLESNLIRDAFDFNTLISVDDTILFVYGCKGAQSTIIENTANHGNQWSIHWDASGLGRVSMLIRGTAGNLELGETNFTPNPQDEAYHNVMILLTKTDATTYYYQGWVDGTPQVGWSGSLAGGGSPNPYDETRDFNLFSNAAGSVFLNENNAGVQAAMAYYGIFRIEQNILSAADQIALDWHKYNINGQGIFPSIMGDY